MKEQASYENWHTFASIKNDSPFEKEIKKIPLDICEAFKNKIGKPILFERKVEQPFNQPFHDRFPNSTASHHNNLLIPTTKMNAAKNKRFCVLFSGGPAAGGHNVIAGLFDMLCPKNTLLGAKNGPRGLLSGDLFKIEQLHINEIKNCGGFDLLGSDRTKIQTKEQFEQVYHVVRQNKLDGIIIVGGDDSNTNACFLAEELFSLGCSVIGVPKTIDGDLRVKTTCPISFGFDTATKIYAEMVGNICQDTPSSGKYWHFIKLMGRHASHVTLEVALQTRPSLTLISEEVAANQWGLSDIIATIAENVSQRAKNKLNHGVILIPEGLIESLSDLSPLIEKINKILSYQVIPTNFKDRVSIIKTHLSDSSMLLFESLPHSIQKQLLFDRDSHGNVQVSQIDTQQLLISMTAAHLKKADPHLSFNAQSHFFGYEGRCGAPSFFDASLTYNLGCVAACLVLQGATGTMASMTSCSKDVTPVAIPLTSLLKEEKRAGKPTIVIEKKCIDLQSPAFLFFKKHRDRWAQTDCFHSPGPRQFWGPTARQMPFSLALDYNKDSRFFHFNNNYLADQS